MSIYNSPSAYTGKPKRDKVSILKRLSNISKKVNFKKLSKDIKIKSSTPKSKIKIGRRGKLPVIKIRRKRVSSMPQKQKKSYLMTSSSPFFRR